MTKQSNTVRKSASHTEAQRPLTQRAGITGLADGVRETELTKTSGESRRRRNERKTMNRFKQWVPMLIYFAIMTPVSMLLYYVLSWLFSK